MKVTLVGGARESALKAAIAKVAPGDHRYDERNKLSWTELADASKQRLDALAAALGEKLTVIEVEVTAVGAAPKAARFTLPGGGREDLSRQANDLFRDHTVHLDPDEEHDLAGIAHAIGLVFAEDVQPPPPPPAVPMGKGKAMPLKRKGSGQPREKPMHAVWAEALIDKLSADEGLELAGDPPVAKVASALSKHDVEGVLPDDFGSTLLDVLVDDDAVEEVFADEDTLLATARATRPR